MKTKNKVLLLVMCAVVLVVGSIFGTMAYLTDKDAVTNTFTAGKVNLTLDEAKVNPDGTYETDKTNRVTENIYHLIPGHTYIKDPVVHVKANSEDCYVFITVSNQIAAIEMTPEEAQSLDAAGEDKTYSSIATQITMNGWQVMSQLAGQGIGFVQKDGMNVYVYAGDKATNMVLPKSDSVTDLPVFESFRIAGDKVIARNGATGDAPEGKYYIDDYNSVEQNPAIIVKAYAVQADGFDTALDAWNATYGDAE